MLRALVLFFLATLPISIYAQTDEAAAERDRILENRRSVLIQRIFSESQSFRRGDNRAIVFARLGSSVWRLDPSAAKSLYSQAVNELINAQSMAEESGDGSQYNELLTGSSARPSVLHTIASYDAEFALRSLYATRPRLIAEALNAERGGRSAGGSSSRIAQNELNLEQSIIAQAARQNPDLAAIRIKDILRKDITGMTLSLLNDLYRYDKAAADSLANEVIEKLITKGFTNGNQPDYQNINVATSFLNQFLQPRNANSQAIRFSDEAIKKLAEELIQNRIEMYQKRQGWLDKQLKVFAEKLAPSLLAPLTAAEKVQEETISGGPEAIAARKFIEANREPEALLAGVNKFPSQYRSQIYQAAAAKLTERGEFGPAYAILSENLSSEEMKSAVENLRMQSFHRSMNSGMVAEAESLIGEMNPNNRIVSYINLARSAYNRDPERNKSNALALLDKARSQLPVEIETSMDMQNIYQLVMAFAEFDPPRAFREIETYVVKLNELDGAYAVINKYQNNYNLRDGEYSINGGISFGYYIDNNFFSRLGIIDFNQTLAIIEKIDRRESRVLLLLGLLDNSPVPTRGQQTVMTLNRR